MSTQIQIDYTNWRKERGIYVIVPDKIWYGSTTWHPKEQWFLRATVVKTGTVMPVIRDFALCDIHSMTPNG